MALDCDAKYRCKHRAISYENYRCWVSKLRSRSRGSAERMWGEFSILAWRILGKSPTNLSANFDGKFFTRFFRPFFSRVSAPPPKKKFTPKIRAQNCRHSAPISHFLRHFLFYTPIFCLRGRPRDLIQLSGKSLVGKPPTVGVD